MSNYPDNPILSPSENDILHQQGFDPRTFGVIS